jgi:hypothetical protein
MEGLNWLFLELKGINATEPVFFYFTNWHPHLQILDECNSTYFLVDKILSINLSLSEFTKSEIRERRKDHFSF